VTAITSTWTPKTIESDVDDVLLIASRDCRQFGGRWDLRISIDAAFEVSAWINSSRRVADWSKVSEDPAASPPTESDSQGLYRLDEPL